jgi:hypothetical protein
VQTFNQPWTDSEQKRLEELLETHPSQDVEMDRWKKIAEELGNRNPVQASFAFNAFNDLYSTEPVLTRPEWHLVRVQTGVRNFKWF